MCSSYYLFSRSAAALLPAFAFQLLLEVWWERVFKRRVFDPFLLLFSGMEFVPTCFSTHLHLLTALQAGLVSLYPRRPSVVVKVLVFFFNSLFEKNACPFFCSEALDRQETARMRT